MTHLARPMNVVADGDEEDVEEEDLPGDRLTEVSAIAPQLAGDAAAPVGSRHPHLHLPHLQTEEGMTAGLSILKCRMPAEDHVDNDLEVPPGAGVLSRLLRLVMTTPPPNT